MKYKIIIIAVFIMMFTNVYAKSNDTLSDGLNAIKSKIYIPIHYTNFTNNIELDKTSNVQSFTWSGENTESENGGKITAKVDDKNRIIYYNFYEYGKFEGNFKLSKYDSNSAFEVAMDFINKVCPEFADKISVKPFKNYYARNNESYTITFFRYINGIPYYDNYIVAVVNAQDNVLRELNVKWYDVEKISPLTNVVSNQLAQENFLKNIGIRLGYLYKDNQLSLQYSPNFNGSNYINAYNGGVLSTEIPSYSNFNPGIYVDKNMFGSIGVYHEIDNNITIDNNIITADKAMEYISAFKIFEVNKDMLVQSNYLANNEGEIFIQLMFSNNIVIILNANTKEIVQYVDVLQDSNINKVMTKEEAIEKADNYLKLLLSDKFVFCEENNSYIKNIFNDDKTFSFYYNRIVNDLAYPQNGILIKINKSSGKLSLINVLWQQGLKFSPDEKVIDKSAAFKEILDRVTYNLQYVAVAKKGILNPQKESDIELRLVYGFRPYKPYFVDASSGALSYANGTLYTDDLDLRFDDIESYPSRESIEVLQSCNILQKSKTFRPNDNITQLEFFQFALKVIGEKPNDNIDELYNSLIFKKVLTSYERNDNANITHEQGIKFLIRLLGFTDIAEIKDTYVTGFVDDGMIDKNLIGYAAIAKGMKIIRGNAFTPKKILTRGVAAEIFYNMITSD